jgi:microfibrillar-associated protein 1
LLRDRRARGPEHFWAMVLPPAPIIDPSGGAGSRSTGDRVPKQNKGQQRWRSGKAPEWAPSDEGAAAGGARAPRQVEEPAVISGSAGAVTHDATDRRLRRLAEGRAAAEGRRRHVADAEILEGDGDDDDDDEREQRHGRHAEEEEEEGGGEEVVKAESDADESEDEDKLEARRARVRELAKRRREQEGEEEEMVAEEEDEEKAGESSDSWEYETDSEGEDEVRLVKPVFVAKTNRATLEERERIEKEEQELEKANLARAEQRKKETRKMVAEELQREQQAVLDRQQRQKHEDTDDEGNEEEEFDKWRLRELRRIKR